MSPSTAHIHLEGPYIQGTSASPSTSDQLLCSPSTFPSPPSSFASTPAAAMAASPATVYSDGLMYQTTSVSDRRQTREHPQTVTVEFVRARPKGTVRFKPFEDDLDAAAKSAIEEFQVQPFGGIEEYCRHIPYASGKKDFYEKTGRESFEVFQYTFRVPGDEKEYHVMWDYNVGLVRMTPFFKCCKYSKTTPAKMLNLNPGLRDITHSITGGSIMAQGYWMPYSCAKAVCATFCYHIAGALIPIFGPEFPFECLPPQSPEYGHMLIDPVLIEAAARDAECMRQHAMKDVEDGTKPLPFHQRRLSQQSNASQQLHQRSMATRHAGTLPPIRSAYTLSPILDLRSERGPKLAPIKHSSPFRRAMLPSPTVNEMLPPFSHIASLSQQSLAVSPLLPPLAVRSSHGPRYHGHSYPGVDDSYPYGPRHQRPGPPLESLGEGRPVAKEADRYGHSPRHARVGFPPPAFVSEMQGFPSHHTLRPPRQDAPSTAHHSLQPPQWTENKRAGHPYAVFSPTHPSNAVHPLDSAQAIEYQEAYDAVEEEMLASSSYYPSPPRLSSLLTYDTDMARRRPPYSTLHGEAARESREKAAVASSRNMASHTPSCRRRQPRTATATGRRKLPTKPKPASSSSPAAHAKDVDAAALLVNLRVKLEEEGAGGYNGADADRKPAGTGFLSQLSRKQGGRQSAASISSLLCDDATLRKKRRKLNGSSEGKERADQE